MKDQAELEVATTVLQTHLGIDGNGKKSKTDSMWEIFSRLRLDKDEETNDKFGLTTSERKRRQHEAALRNLLQDQHQDGQYPRLIIANDDSPNNEWFHVKKKEHSVIVSEGTAAKKEEAENSDLQEAAKLAHGNFSFSGAEAILFDANLPAMIEGYYLVNIRTGKCYLCKDYIKRGCLTDPCKHVWMGRIFNMSREERVLYYERALAFLRNRERSLPEGLRNVIFYSGTKEEVINT